MKVKTPVGDTDRFELNRIEMQGTVPAPLKCSLQIDTFGQYCYTYDTGIYFYKDACAVPPLGMIDDIAGVTMPRQLCHIKFNHKCKDRIKKVRIQSEEMCEYACWAK